MSQKIIISMRQAKPTYLQSVLAVEEGLPISAVDDLADHVAPDDRQFVYSIVPNATLARRRQQARNSTNEAVLSMEESAKVLRVARIYDHAVAAWKSEEAARRFLNRPHMLLDGRTPLDITLKTDEGARVVEEILGKLEFGTAL